MDAEIDRQIDAAATDGSDPATVEAVRRWLVARWGANGHRHDLVVVHLVAGPRVAAFEWLLAADADEPAGPIPGATVLRFDVDGKVTRRTDYCSPAARGDGCLMTCPRSVRLCGAAVILAVLAGAAAGCDASTDTAASPRPTRAASASPLPRGVRTELVAELLNRLGTGRTAPFRAVYDAKGFDSGGLGGGRLTYAQRDDRVHTEFVPTSDGPRVATFAASKGTVVCAAAQQADPWSCYSTSVTSAAQSLAIDYNALYKIVDSYRPAQHWFTFTERQQPMLGMKAWCVDAAANKPIPDDIADRVGTEALFCVAPDGTPLLIRTTGGRDPIDLQATSYTRTFGEPEFTPPSVVAPGPPNVYQPVPPASPTPQKGG